MGAVKEKISLVGGVDEDKVRISGERKRSVDDEKK